MHQDTTVGIAACICVLGRFCLGAILSWLQRGIEAAEERQHPTLGPGAAAPGWHDSESLTSSLFGMQAEQDLQRRVYIVAAAGRKAVEFGTESSAPGPHDSE